MNRRTSSTHRMDTPDKHNGQTDVTVSKFVCFCLRWSLTLTSQQKQRHETDILYMKCLNEVTRE